MPIYEYRCQKGHTFEVLQRMSDDAVTDCRECGASVSRVFHPVAVHFKGSGFYNTDYGKSKGSGSTDGAGKEDGKPDSSDKKEKAGSTSGSSDSGSSKPSESSSSKPSESSSSKSSD